MKNILLTIAFLVFSVVAYAQNNTRLDQDYGFKDAKFETDFSQFKNMDMVQDQGNVKVYERIGDDLKVGNAQLKTIWYFFYKNRLSSVLLKTEGATNSNALLAYLNQEYGKGRQVGKYSRTFAWSGKKTNLSFAQNTQTKDAETIMFSIPLQQEQQQEKKAASR